MDRLALPERRMGPEPRSGLETVARELRNFGDRTTVLSRVEHGTQRNRGGGRRSTEGEARRGVHAPDSISVCTVSRAKRGKVHAGDEVKDFGVIRDVREDPA